MLDENNEILEGHGRFLVVQYLHIDSLPCVILPHLTKAPKKAYHIADNKLTINGAWDENLLGLEFKDLS